MNSPDSGRGFTSVYRQGDLSLGFNFPIEACSSPMPQMQDQIALPLRRPVDLAKAAVHTLKSCPAFNRSLDGDDIVQKNDRHSGFAADTPRGLVVPVSRNADQKSVLEIARKSSDLARLARESKLKPDQKQGGGALSGALVGTARRLSAGHADNTSETPRPTKTNPRRIGGFSVLQSSE